MRSFYKGGYERLPGFAKRAFSEVDFRVANRPGLYYDPGVHPPSPLPRGALTISLDFELAWAWMYAKRETENCVVKGLRERAQVPWLLDLFDRYMLPATWATVGHLFLESCRRGTDGLPHPGHPRAPHFVTENWKYSTGDWFQYDPCTDVRRDPAWYAPDLIEKVMGARARHEIACHGFSHVGFGSYCPADVARAEIEACAEAMKGFGLKPSTLVFPANDAGNFPAIAQSGVRIVRSFPKPGAKVTLPVRLSDSLWGVHVSSAMDRGQGWSLEQRLARFKTFVQSAVDHHLAAHIWLHPSLPKVQVDTVLEPLLRLCAEHRERGELDILTMEQLVAATEQQWVRHGVD